MNIQRITRHLLMTDGKVTRIFGRGTLNKIEAAIKASEVEHVGEIRFAVEGGLDGTPLFKGQSARERAVELFSQLRVWDTPQNTGVLIHLLLADRAGPWRSLPTGVFTPRWIRTSGARSADRWKQPSGSRTSKVAW